MFGDLAGQPNICARISENIRNVGRGETTLNSEKMAAFISYVFQRENRKLQSRPAKIADKILGKPRRVFILTGNHSYFDPKPGTCWWFLSNVPTGEKELIAKEAGKFILGWTGALSAPFLGLDLASTGRDTAEAFKPEGGLLEKSTNAAVWELARKTDAAWVLAMKTCIFGGCAAFEKVDRGYNAWINHFPANKNQSVETIITNWLTNVERKCGSNEAAGVAYTREIAKASRNNQYWLGPNGEIEDFIR